MAKLTRARRQVILDDYFQNTGRSRYVVGEFLDWLEPRTSHECWEWFFKLSDKEAARRWREGRARDFVSDLRITVKVHPPVTYDLGSFQIVPGGSVLAELPAYISPKQDRANGGGYVPLDPTAPAAMAELYGQCADDLRNFLARYGGTLRAAGIPEDGVQATIDMLKDKIALMTTSPTPTVPPTQPPPPEAELKAA